MDPEWFIWDPTPDRDQTFEKVSAPTSDPSKSFGSDRIRNHNTGTNDFPVNRNSIRIPYSTKKNIKLLWCRNLSQLLLWIAIRSDFPFWCLSGSESGSCSKFYTCWKIWKNFQLFQLLFAAMLVYICFIYRIRIHTLISTVTKSKVWWKNRD